MGASSPLRTHSLGRVGVHHGLPWLFWVFEGPLSGGWRSLPGQTLFLYTVAPFYSQVTSCLLCALDVRARVTRLLQSPSPADRSQGPRGSFDGRFRQTRRHGVTSPFHRPRSSTTGITDLLFVPGVLGGQPFSLVHTTPTYYLSSSGTDPEIAMGINDTQEPVRYHGETQINSLMYNKFFNMIQIVVSNQPFLWHIPRWDLQYQTSCSTLTCLFQTLTHVIWSNYVSSLTPPSPFILISFASFLLFVPISLPPSFL